MSQFYTAFLGGLITSLGTRRIFEEQATGEEVDEFLCYRGLITQ
jgi:hypothetical protein